MSVSLAAETQADKRTDSAGRPTRRWRWGEVPAGIVGVAVVLAVVDATAALVRFARFGSGLDLAIFDQAVWHYSRFEAPFSSIRGENLLGDHFHPILALLAPLYWVWSSPKMLLIAQACLVAGSVIPVFLFARDRLGTIGAYLLAGAYGVFWGLQVGVLFDFHEVAFAPLLIALAILFADRRAWVRFWVTIACVLLVKEDQSLLVAFVGLYLLTRREVRHGIAAIVLGIAWYELTTRVFIPDFAHGAAYNYWYYGELGRDLPHAVWEVLRAPWRLVTIAFSPAVKAHTILLLFAPFLFLSLFSRLAILLLPLLAERFLAVSSNYWSTHFHYSLAIAPVLAMSAASGLSTTSRWAGPARGRALVVGATATMLIVSLLVTRLDNRDAALSALTGTGGYPTRSVTGPEGRAIAHLPPGASVETIDTVLAHVSQRRDVELIVPAAEGHGQYLIANALHINCCGLTGNHDYAALGQVVAHELMGMTAVFYDDGWIVARRNPPAAAPAAGVLPVLPVAAGAKLTRAVTAFERSVFTATVRLQQCETSSRSAVKLPTCAARAMQGFDAETTRLKRSERQSGAAAHGACAQLLRDGAAAGLAAAADLERVGRLARQDARVGAQLALFRLVAAEQANDRLGLTERSMLLCTRSPT